MITESAKLSHFDVLAGGAVSRVMILNTVIHTTMLIADSNNC